MAYITIVTKIKFLSDEIINQIAAGEIVEGPSAAMKEIIENAIDANAKNIDVFIKGGGRTKIVITDDGDGISSREDLSMCIMRHATSKMNGSNLFDIHSYGFRGEALPSIASVSNFSIESNGYGISVDFSICSDVFPSKIKDGTRVCISNLFDKTPVRLKFLKSENAELSKCINVVENFALANKDVNITLRTDAKQILSFDENSLESRISEIYGKDLLDKALFFKEEGENISVSGYLFHPSHSKHVSTNSQRLFVNNRVVKDRMVSISTKIGYRGIIEGNRYPLSLLYIDIDPFFIDINISPTKSEVKFRDEQNVQKFLINAITKNVAKFNRVSLDFSFNKVDIEEKKDVNPIEFRKNQSFDIPKYTPKIHKAIDNIIRNKDFSVLSKIEPVSFAKEPVKEDIKNVSFFGRAVVQIFDTYIISINDETNEIFIIDQHAVHEKLTLNKMLSNVSSENIQYLIRPSIVNISYSQVLQFDKISAKLEKCGFKIDLIRSETNASAAFVDGANAIDISSQNNNQSALIINAIPGIMKINEVVDFINDVIDDSSDIIDMRDYIVKRFADDACHNSIRAGRNLNLCEMNELIKNMESAENIHQCNHHRPSFLKLTRDDLEKMFKRS